jgi:hypothetical protein
MARTVKVSCFTFLLWIFLFQYRINVVQKAGTSSHCKYACFYAYFRKSGLFGHIRIVVDYLHWVLLSY